jgi:N-terminal domain on NACHT_NTPase and P-loop NTPases
LRLGLFLRKRKFFSSRFNEAGRFRTALSPTTNKSVHIHKPMDPVTAVGFAASILTFIDVSHQVISGTWEVIKSGTTTENAHVGNVINDLHDVTKQLSDRPPGYSQHERALNTLASECQELSGELVALLEKLKSTAGSSKWKSVKVALHSMWKKGDVEGLERRLDKYRSQILLRLVLMLK